MRTALPLLTRVLAVIFALLFGLSLMAALLLYNAQTKLFEAATYKTALQEQNFYARLPNLLAEQISLRTPGYLSYLTVPDWEALIKALIPPDQLRAISEQGLDSLFDFLNGKNNNPVINIQPVKQTLISNSAALINRFLSAQPACTNEQLNDLSLKLLSGQTVDSSMLCNPPQELLSLALPLVSNIFDTEIASIPDTLPIMENNRLLELRARVEPLRQLMRLSPLLPLFFLALLTLLAVRSLVSWLKWWGLPLAISGALALIVSQLASPLSLFLLTYATTRDPATAGLARLWIASFNVIQAILTQVTNPMAIESLVIMLLGLILLLAAWLLSRRSTPAEYREL